MNLSLALRILAWLLLLALVFVTLAPIEFRPVTPLPVQIERGTALAVIGFVFALAYPRHIILVGLIVLGATILLEALQLLVPTRHGRLPDLAVKLAGGAIGLAIGLGLDRLRHRN